MTYRIARITGDRWIAQRKRAFSPFWVLIQSDGGEGMSSGIRDAVKWPDLYSVESAEYAVKQCLRHARRRERVASAAIIESRIIDVNKIASPTP